MIIHYLSASRIKTYLQCSEKYFQQYENKVKGNQDHLIFGTMMHSVFERYFQEDISIKEIFEQEWQKAPIASLEYYQDGQEIMKLFEQNNNRLEITPIGFEVPFAIDILNNEIIDTSIVDWKNKDQAKVFLEGLENIDTPIVFGFIDRLDYVLNEDTGQSYLKIVDYKTSRVPLTQPEADEDIQLSMYALVARYLYPEYEYTALQLQYVRFGVFVETQRTDSELDLFREYLLSLYYKIKNDTTPVATLNRFCGFCDSRHGCIAYQELLNGEPDDFNLDEISDEQLDEQLEKIKVHMKILDGRKKELERYFQSKLSKTDNSPIDLGDSEMYLSTNARKSYDVFTVLNLFPEHIENLFTVSKKAVDDLVKDNPQAQEQLENTSTKYFISPTLRKRKKK